MLRFNLQPAKGEFVKRRPVIGALFVALLASFSFEADAEVFGVQPGTGNILRIDPATGLVLSSYATPAAIASTQTTAGLTYAAPLDELLYLNSNASTTLFRLSPNNGAVLSTAFGDSFSNAGLSYERDASNQDLLFYAHTNIDIHRQVGFGDATGFFWAIGTPGAGLGGDGYGREFGIFDDGQIHEYNPFVDTNSFISGFAAPTGALGLAFDGINLFVSTNQGQLLTLNPNSGAVLNSVAVAGGNLVELGARRGPSQVPEPATLFLLGAALAGLGVARRLNKRTASL